MEKWRVIVNVVKWTRVARLVDSWWLSSLKFSESPQWCWVLPTWQQLGWGLPPGGPWEQRVVCTGCCQKALPLPSGHCVVDSRGTVPSLVGTAVLSALVAGQWEFWKDEAVWPGMIWGWGWGSLRQLWWQNGWHAPDTALSCYLITFTLLTRGGDVEAKPDCLGHCS